jgi:serine/threonine protein kinase
MAGDDPRNGEGGASGGNVPEALAPGAIVAGTYELRHPLGTGGMGVVWAASHRGSGAMVALKFLRAGPGGADDSDSLKRFLREARAAASVRHPHVVAIREVLELPDGRPMMVMELLTGETLRTRLTRGPRLGLEEAASILLPVVSAVGTAHAQGIVHRDLKPDNIFLSQDASGRAVVKVLDFGIAKVTRISEEHASHGHGLTATGEVLGTPNYMSPEQVFGERDIDHRADVWAMGVILYECLSGVVPTKAANVGQVFKLIVTGGIKPLQRELPEAPDDIADLVHRMLARRRDQRPSDLNAVAAVLGNHTTVAVPTFGSPLLSSSPVVGPGEPAPNADETIKRLGDPDPLASGAGSLSVSRRRMGRLTTIGIGTLVVSVLLGESFLLWRAHSRRLEAAAAAASTADAGAASVSAAPAPGAPRPGQARPNEPDTQAARSP